MSLTTESAARKDRTQPTGRAVFQHRHYAEIARIIRHGGCRENTAEHFAEYLAVHNPNFNRKRFLAACEP